MNQAHHLSKPDFSQLPASTTTPDDAFYILKVVLFRLLTTGNAGIVERASERLRDVMDRDYAGVIKKKLDDVYRTGGSGSTVKGEKESRQAFIVGPFRTVWLSCANECFIQILLNDLDISSSHMERLIKDLCTSSSIIQNFLEPETESAKSSMASFNNLIPRFRSTLRVSSGI